MSGGARRAVHFGAGNIGRGFIGEVLCRNGFFVDFVDVNETLVAALKERGAYTVEIAAPVGRRAEVRGVGGLNGRREADAVAGAIARAALVTTALGPPALPRIAGLLARGVEKRMRDGVTAPLDVIACENMIGASAFLERETRALLDGDARAFADRHVGFPNAAVDRIVPPQKHDDPLYVVVEEFREWVVDDPCRKARGVTLDGVIYVPDLLPYVERKLFTVNTGHACAGYAGTFYGHAALDAALADGRVRGLVRRVLAETGALLRAKWGFDAAAHEAYAAKTMARFENPAIKDPLSHAARAPLRKLGFDERFIRPVRELKERGLPYAALLETLKLLFAYDNAEDEESVRLRSMLRERPVTAVLRAQTGLGDDALIEEIARAVTGEAGS